MAVRTRQAGIKNKREVDVRSATPNTGATKGRKTLARDDAALERRAKTAAKMKLGPAAKTGDYERGTPGTPLKGRKKAPSEMRIKHKGGPFKRTRLHGG